MSKRCICVVSTRAFLSDSPEMAIIEETMRRISISLHLLSPDRRRIEEFLSDDCYQMRENQYVFVVMGSNSIAHHLANISIAHPVILVTMPDKMWNRLELKLEPNEHQDNAIPEERAFLYAHDLYSALDHAHRMLGSCIPRQTKPKNVLQFPTSKEHPPFLPVSPA